MRWPALLISIGWLAIFLLNPLFVLELRAEEKLKESPPLPEKQSYLPETTLLRQNSSAHFHLILGRLRLDPVRYRKGSLSVTHPEPSSQEPGQSLDASTVETMTVTSARGKPSVRYTLTQRDATLSIDADSLGNVHLHAERQIDGYGRRRVSIEQLEGKLLTMRCTLITNQSSPGESYTVQGRTWLHLREADRQVFVNDVEPVLDELLQPYRFEELADQAHAQSLQQSMGATNEELVVEEAQIKTWIDDLRSPSRIRRIDAEKKLTAVGISLLPRLAHLDSSSWDAEQRLRLQEIQAKLTPMAEDDGMRLAVLIRDDRDYWRLASSRLDDRERAYVADRFLRLGAPSPITQMESSRIATRPQARDR